jgi:2-amino-4-hydroxy-6-hydroxymethyldihydropteridine diphosphokinase
MNHVYLALGSNRGNRIATLEKAIKLIEHNNCHLLRKSSFYETKPWKMEDKTNFINAVISVDTPISAIELMKSILKIEEKMGRKRYTPQSFMDKDIPENTINSHKEDVRYKPRIIDIDILFFNDELISIPGLKIPHCQIDKRMFVLAPLNEIAPGYIHPVMMKSIAQLMEECRDKEGLKKL